MPAWENAKTTAWGLRVPAAVGDFMILDAIRASEGCAVAVPEADIADATRLGSSLEGVAFCPEAGACILAAQKLIADGRLEPDERVVLFNTATGIKYQDTAKPALPLLSAREPVDYAKL